MPSPGGEGLGEAGGGLGSSGENPRAMGVPYISTSGPKIPRG